MLEGIFRKAATRVSGITDTHVPYDPPSDFKLDPDGSAPSTIEYELKWSGNRASLVYYNPNKKESIGAGLVASCRSYKREEVIRETGDFLKEQVQALDPNATCTFDRITSEFTIIATKDTDVKSYWK